MKHQHIRLASLHPRVLLVNTPTTYEFVRGRPVLAVVLISGSAPPPTTHFPAKIAQFLADFVRFIYSVTR
jgi:hypothetical protein